MAPKNEENTLFLALFLLQLIIKSVEPNAKPSIH